MQIQKYIKSVITVKMLVYVYYYFVIEYMYYQLAPDAPDTSRARLGTQHTVRFIKPYRNPVYKCTVSR